MTSQTAKFLFASGLLYLAIMIAMRFPFQAAYGDELHFWPSTQWLFSDGFPSITKLRNYPELSTPLPFLVVGTADLLIGHGLTVGRIINLAVSFSIILLIGIAGQFSIRAVLACTGLLAFPYFLFTSIYFYTDVIAIIFAVGGTLAARHDRHWLASALFILGIASRQYVVAFPAAICALLILQFIRRKSRSEAVAAVPYAIATISIAGWYFFFGHAAPQMAIAAQSLSPGHIYPDHALYFLTTIGAFFVLPEAILFRTLTFRLSVFRIGLMLVVIAGFIAFPPITNVNTITDTMGYMDKTFRIVLSDIPRMIAFCALAILPCLRFDPFSTAGFMLYANTTLLMGAHVGWEKYAMPLIAVLWLLKSMNRLNDNPFRTPQTDEGFNVAWNG